MMATAHKSLLKLSVASVIALAILLGLGFWQVERLAWKEDLISLIDTRIHNSPVALDQALASKNAGEDIRYLRISVNGVFIPEQELYLFTVINGRTGWLVYSPFETSDGVLIVNRGFVGAENRDPASRPGNDIYAAQQFTITGLARDPEQQAAFVPDNDLDANIWYWRDLDAMAAAFDLPAENVLPFYLDLQLPVPESRLPQPGVTNVTLSNKHMGYAITWFGLAAVLVVIFLVFARRLAKGTA